ncbi:MAG: bifunctional 5,10-methylenetetrahydrofolate dehydrogenase/5,10-methenyltetrahydrofolate cyclohydrolase, partial [Oscillospiraceae bacterium]
MVRILKGDVVSQEIKMNIQKEIEKLSFTGKTPGLAFVAVGDDEGTKAYLNSKKKDCSYCGIKLFDFILEETTTTQQLLNVIEDLNKNKDVNGIIIGLPLPKCIDTDKVIEKIDPNKDVDSLSTYNLGKLMMGKDSFVPCTPAAVISILDYYNIDVESKNCVIIGRSNIVGKPMAMVLMNRNATVTICHKKTTNLQSVTKNADIIVSAAGDPMFLSSNMVKKGAVVVDVGINRLNGKIVGDVDFEDVSKVASSITPVPGGVGV